MHQSSRNLLHNQSTVMSISRAEFYLNLMKTVNDSAVRFMKFVNAQ